MKDILEQLVQPVSEILTEHAEEFLQKTEDLLLKSAEKAGSNQEEDELFRLIRVIQQHGEVLMKNWQQNISSLMLEREPGTPGGNAPITGLAMDDVELVDITNFDEWVVLAGVAYRVEARYSSQIYQLEQRLSLLFSRPVDRESNPFGPLTILRAFQQAIDEYSPSPNCQQLILRAVEQEILTQLGPVYDAINSLLEENGICPDLRYKAEKHQGPTRQVQQVQQTQQSPDTFTEADGPAVNRQTPPPDGVTPTGSGSNQGSALVKDIMGSVHADLRLPPSFKDMMVSLEKSLANLAREEPDFLRDPRHPAMEVINSLEKLSIAVSAEHGPKSKHSTLNTIINDTFSDLAMGAADSSAAFIRARDYLNPIVKKNERAFQVNVQRVTDKFRGQEKLFHAKELVANTLDHRLANKRIARCLVNLLKLGWESLLTLTALGKCEENKEWDRYILVVDQLLLWFDPSAQSPPKDQQLVDTVIETLKQGIAQISANPVALDNLNADIQKALRGNQQQFRKLQHDRLLVRERSNDGNASKQGKLKGDGRKSTLAHWEPMIRTIKIGDWLLEKMPGEWMRNVNLSWTGQRGHLFVFVDGKGMEALSLDLDTLAEYLQSGRLEVLNDGTIPLMQRSTQRMLEREIQQQTSSTEGDRRRQQESEQNSTPSSVPQRALYVIMLTDIVGYSRMMERNEKLAFELLQAHNNLIRECIGKYHGEEIKTMGDAFLVVFTSAMDAVDCAKAIHASMTGLKKGVTPDMAIQLRIGIHLGDVIRLDRDVFGDGVNVVARIEPLAPPGGICFSDGVYNLIRKQIDLEVEEMEFFELKNISMPPRLYRVSAEQCS